MDKKICSKCRIEKELSEFHLGKSVKDGLSTWCKDCHKEYSTLWRKNNKERIIENSKKYYLENKEKRKEYILKNKEKRKEYRKINQERIKEYNTNWRSKNKDYTRNNKEAKKQYNKKYNTTHKELRNIQTQKRNAKKRKLLSTFTVHEWDLCKQYFNNECAYCGIKLPLTQDHFISINNGGSYVKENIIPSCQSCNSSKSDKSFSEWYPKYRFYSKEREENIYKYFNLLNNY